MTKNRMKMIEHIPAEKLEKLSGYELSGLELVKWLEHLETCEICRRKMEKPSVEQIIERLLVNEPESEVDKIEAGVQTQQ